MGTLDPRRSTVAQVWRFEGDDAEYEAMLRRTARAFPKAAPVMFCWSVDLLATKTPWWLVPLVWYPLSLAAIASGILYHGASSWAAVAGIAVWPVLEYVMHRWVFHATPRNKVTRVLLYVIHNMHHAYPNDPYRLVLPLTLSVPLAAMYMFVCTWFMSSPSALVFTAGTASAYAFYDVMHYIIHHMHTVRRWRVFAAAKQRHINRHHMGDDRSANFGITTGLIDVVARRVTR